MSTKTDPDELLIGLVSISDRASGGVYEDKGIPALQEWFGAALTSPWRMETRLIPDDRAQIEQTLIELVDVVGCDLVLTTGGTGPSRRDVTPEATLAVATKEMPGFGEQMRQISLQFVPTAILSRQVAVIRETNDRAALIMNLPGQPKSIRETLEGVKDADGKQQVAGIFAAVPYCIDLIGGPYIETNEAVCKAFRPKSAIRPANKQSSSTRTGQLICSSAQHRTIDLIKQHLQPLRRDAQRISIQFVGGRWPPAELHQKQILGSFNDRHQAAFAERCCRPITIAKAAAD